MLITEHLSNKARNQEELRQLSIVVSRKVIRSDTVLDDNVVRCVSCFLASIKEMNHALQKRKTFAFTTRLQIIMKFRLVTKAALSSLKVTSLRKVFSNKFPIYLVFSIQRKGFI